MTQIEQAKIKQAIGILQSLITAEVEEVERTPFGYFITIDGKKVKAILQDGKWVPEPPVEPVIPEEMAWNTWNVLPSAPFVYDNVPAPEGYEYRYHPGTGERKIVKSCTWAE
jgi:hypothetical protein